MGANGEPQLGQESEKRTTRNEVLELIKKQDVTGLVTKLLEINDSGGNPCDKYKLSKLKGQKRKQLLDELGGPIQKMTQTDLIMRLREIYKKHGIDDISVSKPGKSEDWTHAMVQSNMIQMHTKLKNNNRRMEELALLAMGFRGVSHESALGKELLELEGILNES